MTLTEVTLLLKDHLGEIALQNEEFDFRKISILELFDFIYALETELNLQIPIEKISAENFKNAEQIYRLICEVTEGKINMSQLISPIFKVVNKV